ncbi:fatty acid--CoA ligase family protein [Williamsia sp.]|uniref:class I adenylate-forming enzyme family protein n=1 Tax=Williamsia sp. TaxID=1872085 RepID=UPI002F95A10F
MTGTDTDPGTRFAAELDDRLSGYGDAPFIEFDGQWHSGNDIAHYRELIDTALTDAGVGPTESVGIVVRNRVPHAAAIFDFIATRRPMAMIYSYQSENSIARDIEILRPAAVVVDRQDWTAPVRAACRRIGAAAVVLSLTDPIVEPALSRNCETADQRGTFDLPGLHILTSGTTGPPKRLPLPTRALQHTVLSMTIGQTATPDDPPELVYWPFGSIGICQVLAAPFLQKRMVLLEKFNVEEWVRAVRTHRIARTGVQPAILRMVLDAGVPPDDLASLQYLPGGSGPLDPELRERFERTYDVTLLWGYGATEFAGSVCAWTPDLHQEFGETKRGSVGRPLPGVEVRIIDPDTGAPATAGAQGRLEARSEVLDNRWVATTDIASIDADGFVTIHGRGDGAINRGGFKILPETVRGVLLEHPSVLDAAVVGVDDRLLGHVPFAAVEVRTGLPVPTEEMLKELVRESLPSHHVPVAIAVVDELPRNAALKVKVKDVAALYR